MSDLEAKICSVWEEHGVIPTGVDMSNECRLADGILKLRCRISELEKQVADLSSALVEAMRRSQRGFRDPGE